MNNELDPQTKKQMEEFQEYIKRESEKLTKENSNDKPQK